jgi:hypothetical protein
MRSFVLDLGCLPLFDHSPLCNVSQHISRTTVGQKKASSQSQRRESARLSLHSSELDPPIPSPAGECCTPLRSRGGAHSLAGKEMGGPNSDEGTDTVVSYVYSIIPLSSHSLSFTHSPVQYLKNKRDEQNLRSTPAEPFAQYYFKNFDHMYENR